ncbi:MAG: hypothetical protein AB7K24_19985 [Gemmataceae bacterium]
MNRFFRPMILIPAWVLLSGIALALVFLPAWQGAPVRALPRPVPVGDQEVVFLNQATSTAAWERFVAALRSLHDDPDSGIEIVDEQQAFPSATTAVPEIAVRQRGRTGRVWFRWYKLTGDIDTAQWVQALMGRQPAPLAIIGGSTSDRARDLARDLHSLGDQERAPLLLITTATADQVDLDYEVVDLMSVYPGRSFRFCFTNQQMAEAVIDFLWTQPEVRPDVEPVYLVHWDDDPFSVDLKERFAAALSDERFSGWLQQRRRLRHIGREWSDLAARALTAGVAPGLCPDMCLAALAAQTPWWSVRVGHSIGGYARPNRAESAGAAKVMEGVAMHPNQRRPLLILPAGTQPTRRFLHALFRLSPDDAARFVVATGDFDFNTIYRDRMVAWPIQDLPVDLVFFSHRNPVDPIGFVPSLPDDAIPDLTSKSTTNTMDLLLYRDIAETVIHAAYQEGRLLDRADTLRKRLREARLPDGQPRFDESGNLRSGSGEFVVWLRPIRNRELNLPRAGLQVWNRSTSPLGQRVWQRVPVDGLDELIIDYVRQPAE